MKFGEILNFLQENRIVKREDEMTSLLDLGAVTTASLKKAPRRNRYIGGFLSQRVSTKKVASAVR